MSRPIVFVLFFLAVFLQAGAYGLTFMLPDLFKNMGGNEKDVGQMLAITALTTLVTVYYSGHLSDIFGRIATLAGGCLSIAVGLFLFGFSTDIGFSVICASAFLGAGWGLTYALAPIVLTRLVTGKERVRYFALNSIFVMAGFGLAPVMTSLMTSSGLTIADAFFATSAFCTISGVLFFILISPIRNHSLTAQAETGSKLTLTSITEILRSPAALPVFMVFLGASVFAGLNNFQTTFAQERGVNYATYFMAYTLTVVLFRVLLVRFTGGKNPYLTIAGLQYIMAASIILFIFISNSQALYILVAVLFGIGYGASYPILVAMAANDADQSRVPQTLQLFALTYFIGVFGFPLFAGWMIAEVGTTPLLWVIVAFAIIEASLAAKRALRA